MKLKVPTPETVVIRRKGSAVWHFLRKGSVHAGICGTAVLPKERETSTLGEARGTMCHNCWPHISELTGEEK